MEPTVIFVSGIVACFLLITLFHVGKKTFEIFEKWEEQSKYDWGPWEEIESGMLTDDGVKIGRYLTQKRTCKKTGKSELRTDCTR